MTIPNGRYGVEMGGNITNTTELDMKEWVYCE